MNRNLFIIFGIFIAVLVAGFFMMQRPVPVVDPGLNPEPSFFASEGEVVEITIIGNEFSFSPNDIAVNKGDRVRINFVNGGRLSHDISFPDLGVSTAVIDAGETEAVEFVAENSGVFEFICTVIGHKSFGMTGKLIVN
jgi:plastocyanin